MPISLLEMSYCGEELEKTLYDRMGSFYFNSNNKKNGLFEIFPYILNRKREVRLSRVLFAKRGARLSQFRRTASEESSSRGNCSRHSSKTMETFITNCVRKHVFEVMPTVE